jgi:hypothetical protein
VPPSPRGLPRPADRSTDRHRDVLLRHQRDERIRPGAERAYPSCVAAAGNPGTAGELTVAPANVCPAADPTNDDGAGNGMYGFPGAARAAWVKRFTPSCYPFKVTGIDVKISHASVPP